MTEIWRPVLDHEGRYEVSSFGRVRGLDRLDPLGRRVRGRVKKLCFGKDDYLTVGLSDDRGVQRTAYAHILVLEAFVGVRPPGMVACHGDGDNQNNVPSNLRWDTPKANTADIRSHGNMYCGERHYHAKVCETDVERIRDMCRSGGKQADMARLFGVGRPTITLIKQGRIWAHVT